MWNSSSYFMTRNGNEARLTIREVKDTDAGVYECNAGSVSTKATVTVKGEASRNIKTFRFSASGKVLHNSVIVRASIL